MCFAVSIRQLHVSATAVFKLFTIAPDDYLTSPLWRCLDLKKRTRRHRSGNW